MRLNIISLILLCLFTNIIQAQVKFRVKKLNADSLTALISEKEGTEKIDVFNLLSNVICRKDIDSSIHLANMAIELSEKLEYQKGLADGYHNLGNGYFLHDSLQPTIANYLKACRFYEDLEPCIEYGTCCLQIALLNYFTKGPEESPPYLDKAIKTIYSLGNNEDKYSISFVLSHANSVLYPPKPDSIIYYGLIAISYIDTVVDHNEMAFIYSSIGEGYSPLYMQPKDTSDLTKALFWFTKALKLPLITDDLKITLFINMARTHLGFNTEEHTSEAIFYLQKAIEIPDTCFGVYGQKAVIYHMLGSISYIMSDYIKAINLYQQGVQISEDRLSSIIINEYRDPIHGYNYRYHIKYTRPLLYKGVYNAYLKLGKYDKALEYYILSKQKADEVFLEQNQNLITMLEAVSIDEKNKGQIELLASENELNKLKIRQSRTLMILLGGFAIFFVLIAIIIFRQRKIRSEQKLLHDLELKEVESTKLKELDKMKSRFFANISHEFRTPLTLIMRPLEKVLSKIEDSQHKKDLDVAIKYAGKLQILINNLLTISKLESGKMQLRTSENDVAKLTRNYTNAFESLAKQNNITLNFESEFKEIKAFVDLEKFEQVLNNLLSNAFKFTGEGGEIKIAVGYWPLAISKNDVKPKANNQQPTAIQGQCAEIRISDTGRGIAPEHINHIFDRFYQVEQENNNYFEGTGIGLALTKELVELHHGKIEVESEPGKGTTFTIFIPLGKDHLKPEEITEEKSEKIKTPTTSTVISEIKEISDQQQISSIQHPEIQPILLIVEDNNDMRVYIREYFEADYQVIEAVDGLDGLKKSIEHIPDIIISDVMMPNMDGNVFCKKIKTDERTSHIPVILLTARASSEHKMEGLEIGADDFITKPFDGKELKVRVKNLVQQRKRIREMLERKIRASQSILQIDFADSGITSMDEQFMQKVIKVLIEHHSNPELNITELGHLIGLSVAQLNRKIKALTDQSTAEFIRSFRLTRAAELIRKKSATVTEIAYDVGFSSPSYFSECFKTYFGKLPSEFNGNT